MEDGLDKLTHARLSASASTPRVPLRQQAPALIVFAIGVLITYAVQQRQAELAERAAAAAFETRAQEVSTQLAVALRMHVQSLRSFAGVMQVFPQLRAAELGRYAARLSQDDPAIAAVHWLPRVTAMDRSALELRLDRRLTEWRAGRWEPAAARDVYLPIASLAPSEDPSWLGRDRLGAFGDNALLKALSTGQVVASVMPRVPGREPIISLVKRICPPDPARAPGQDAAPIGLVELWIRIAPGLREITTGLAAEDIFVSLYDLSAPQGQHLLYSSAPAALASQALSEAFGRGQGVDIQLADRWLRAVVSRQPRTANPPNTALTLVSGASISALLALLLAVRRSLSALRVRLAAARQLGPYRLERELGAGTMGTVYLAHHQLLQRPTAVKLFDPSHMDPQALARFEREVQQTATLCHPNTIAVYDFGRTSDGFFYYAMEYLEGVNLQKLVERTGRQPPGRVLWIVQQVAGALAESHASGLIHRDIKPANLMLCVRGGVYDFLKVLDFGLVRDLRDPQVLEGDAFVGTPLYAAPEAYQHPERVDARSDLYSLGATAYFLLTGREPFGGARVIDVLEQHVSSQPASFAQLGVHTVPEPIEQLVLRCLAKQPERRPESADALRRQVEQLRGLAPWQEGDARAAWQDQRALLVAPAAPRADGRISTQELALGETMLEHRSY